MKRLFLSLAAVILVFSLAWAGSPKLDFTEGEWEISIETELSSMPMKMPPFVYTQCMTHFDPVPQNNQPNQQCKLSDVKTTNDTVSWTIICDTQGGKMSGKGKITYKKETMNGSMVMEGQGIKMTSNFKGRYIGPCKK